MENNDIILDGSTATWLMPRTEGQLGGTYIGSFRFRCYLDPIRELQAGREYRALLGDLGKQATEKEGNLAFALVQLKHRIIKAPPFWTSTEEESGMAGNIGDLNVIMLILDAAIRSENLYVEKMTKEKEEILNKSIKIGEELIQESQEE